MTAPHRWLRAAHKIAPNGAPFPDTSHYRIGCTERSRPFPTNPPKIRNHPVRLHFPDGCNGRSMTAPTSQPTKFTRPPFIFSSYLFEVIHNVYRLSTLKLWKTRWKLWKTHPVFHRLHAARAKTRWKTPKFPVGNSALFDAKLLHSPRENVKIGY